MNESSATNFSEGVPYRSLSKTAVMSAVLAVLSLTAYIAPGMLLLPVVATALGISALIAMRRYPRELSGKPFAVAGFLSSVFILVSGSALHAYVYATELPEGYERVSFSALKPNSLSKKKGMPVPQEAIDLHGKKIFIKGYVHPGVAGAGNIQNFILVPDMGTCCFGGQPELTDMVEVTLKDTTIKYSTRKRKLAGVFTLDFKRKKMGGIDGGFYRLEAEYVK